MSVSLRWAEPGDKDFFLAVRNDVLSVRFSYSQKPVDPAAHDRWWRETGDALFVAEVKAQEGLGAVERWRQVRTRTLPGDTMRPVGTVRLSDVDDATCEVHLALVATERGKGYAAGMLQEAREMAGELGYSRIIARVDSPNTASLRAFLRAGYCVKSPGVLLLEREI